jgi:hypothetical protein
MITYSAMEFPTRVLLLAVWICWGGSFCLGQTSAHEFRLGRMVENDGWESVSQSKILSATARGALTKAVAGVGAKSEQELQQTAAHTRIKAIDLGGKGGEEFLAQGFGVQSCSPTGNCETWVLRQNGDNYSVILHRGAAQTFTIQPTVTNSLHDIVLGMHGSATMQGLTLYRFDGTKYRRAGCYVENFTMIGKDGGVQNLDEPRITPCSKLPRKQASATAVPSTAVTIAP